MIFIDQKLFEDDISVIFDRFSSSKCLSITKNLANAKLLVVGKHLAAIQMLTDLTYLPDLTIDEKLD